MDCQHSYLKLCVLDITKLTPLVHETDKNVTVMATDERFKDTLEAVVKSANGMLKLIILALEELGQLQGQEISAYVDERLSPAVVTRLESYTELLRLAKSITLKAQSTIRQWRVNAAMAALSSKVADLKSRFPEAQP